MKSENEKKGLFARLTESKKSKKSSCCGSFEVEEIPDENDNKKDKETSKESDGNSCCK